MIKYKGELLFTEEEYYLLYKGEILKVPELNEAYLLCNTCKTIVTTTKCLGSSHVCLDCTLKQNMLEDLVRKRKKTRTWFNFVENKLDFGDLMERSLILSVCGGFLIGFIMFLFCGKGIESIFLIPIVAGLFSVFIILIFGAATPKSWWGDKNGIL